VVIQYRAQNLDIVPRSEPPHWPSPRVSGTSKVIVDDLRWHWQDASGEPAAIIGLPLAPGRLHVMRQSTDLT
jgi:hypothetical protein